jgi:hypothetical protein
MPSPHPYLRRTTTSVLVAVALVSGAVLLLGDRFDAARGDVLAQTVPAVAPEARIAACVADESMRLIDPDRDRCRPGERELVSEHRLAAAASAGVPVADAVSGYEVVTAKTTVPTRQSATAAARCPLGKVAVGGGVLPDGDAGGKGGAPEDRMDVVASAPLLAGGDPAGAGWTAAVRNTSGTAPLAMIVAVICLAAR